MRRLTSERARELREVAKAFLDAAFPAEPVPHDMRDKLRKLK